MKSAKRQREKGASDTEESERAGAKKSKTQVSHWLQDIQHGASSQMAGAVNVI